MKRIENFVPEGAFDRACRSTKGARRRRRRDRAVRWARQRRAKESSERRAMTTAEAERETGRVRDIYRKRRALGERHDPAVYVVSIACRIRCSDVKHIVADIREEIEQAPQTPTDSA